MKIALFVNKDLEANIAYNLLKPELEKHTVRIYYSDTVGNPNTKPSALVKLEYFEKEFVFNELTSFLTDNKIHSTFEFFDPNFKSFPLKKCTNVNSSEFINEMKIFGADLFIAIRFGKIFKDELIQLPKKGIINLHSAILPAYRGIMGTLHAIKAKNTTIGCTLHTIPNSGIDTGEIIEIATLKVNPTRSLFWHIIQLYPLGAKLIVKTIKNITENTPLITRKQQLKEGNYFSVPTSNDFDQLKRLGMETISINDYQTIVKSFILNELTENEEQTLVNIIGKHF